ncbi:hypothetical protein PNEG_03282 [Pneumocystis murina B123]|uniref:Phospholipid:diacylglycerol acyltransferase n=1 Tax=Pneumocystis murina (strain B123) TaxID=1069680 RepID=M7NMK3_PNEMU|nr:hypothetical protein PNEG_03282 [Pneumocystis murina B123]EMR08452.2 hypothetical protein PNEG_03282 [Pneumocystis murina B123]
MFNKDKEVKVSLESSSVKSRSGFLRNRLSKIAHVKNSLPIKQKNIFKDSDFKRHFVQYRRVVFVFGIIVGAVITGIFIKRSNIVDFDWDFLLGFTDIGDFMEELRNILPASVFDDAKKLSYYDKDSDYEAFFVGNRLREQGYKPYFNVIIVPGVISTGLESWSTSNCSSLPYFRKRLWGSWTMLRAMLMDKKCWVSQLMLNETTGLDPEGVKLRAAQGLSAADFFVTGYWIWNKIIENLAAIGYDPNNMFSAAYDWRLSFLNLEERGIFQYFFMNNGLSMFLRSLFHQASIEIAKATSGKKSVIISHSMGSQLTLWFLKWVEADGYGNGGKSWVNDHIEAFINISGSLLGTPKAVTALLSGEVKDTTQLNAISVYGLERFFSKFERVQLLRSLPGIASMLPKGENVIWGNATWAPDDLYISNVYNLSFGSFINFRKNSKTSILKNLTMSDSMDYLISQTSHTFHKMLSTNYSHGISWTEKSIEMNNNRPEKWINPLEVSLPNAPNMKIYCIGKPTERAYWYDEGPKDSNLSKDSAKVDLCDCINNTMRIFSDPDIFGQTPFIDNTVNIKPYTEKGVVMGEGDGTVNILSTGFMCVKGWKQRRYNPANISVIVHEMLHQPDRHGLRGGSKTADHVDILGRSELNELILRIVSGNGDTLLKNKILSNIMHYSDQINIDNKD